MCGIIGYTGPEPALPIVMKGLATLEYRGYDSAGVAVDCGDDHLMMVKKAGKLSVLADNLNGQDAPGTTGLGHTRWATHGEPNDPNSHPHLDATGNLAIVHNGIIENHAELAAELAAEGHTFVSDTDTEVVAHLIGSLYEGSVAAAVRAALPRIEGQFAIAAIDRRNPGELVATRRDAPLVLGHADGAALLASDVAGLIAHTRDVESLENDQIASLTSDGITVTDAAGNAASGHRFTVDWDIEAAEKSGFEHFMRKEIHEQPQAVADTLLDRIGPDGQIQLDALRVDPDELRFLDKVYIVACGTSSHAGMVGKYAIEHWAGLGVEVEIASEFRYRDPILNPHTLVIAISQSGETADTIAAAVHARTQGAKVITITNVVGSTLARDADAVLYTRAGPEIAVASTKAFTTQLVALDVLALFLAQARRKLFAAECRDLLYRFQQLPELITKVVEAEDDLAALAAQFATAPYFMFIGRQVGLPIALEGALKLKEISYLHAEGFAAGEMKHGPIALIGEGGPVIALATDDHVRSKMLSNIAEVKARGAVVLAIATEGDTEITEHADHIIYVPSVHELLSPVLTVVPLQLLAYAIAVELGRDVDQPRNLAKTVTVE